MENLGESVRWSDYVVLLGTSLHRLRIERGLSQEQVANQAGLSRYTYQKFEKGESRPGTPANPSLQNVLSLCNVFGVQIGELLPAQRPDLSDR